MEEKHEPGFRKPIDKIIGAFRKRQGDFIADSAVRMVERGDGYKLIRQVDSGKMDIGDERILAAYLQTIDPEGSNGQLDFQISQAVGVGVSLDKIAQDQRISERLVNKLIMTMLAQMAHARGDETDDGDDFYPSGINFDYYFPIQGESGQLLELLIQDPEHRQKLTEAVDIQAYGEMALRESHALSDNDFLDNSQLATERRQEIIHHIELLKQLGYEPFRSDAELKLVFEDYHPYLRQENLAAIGLIDQPTVDRMYQYEWQQLKQRAEDGGETEIPKLSPDLEPSGDDPLASYWHAQSKELGQDAMELIMGQCLGQKTEADQELFDERGLPTPELFADEYPLPLYSAKRYNIHNHARLGSALDHRHNYTTYDEATMTFLAQNEDRIADAADRAFVRQWAALDSEAAKQAFMIYATTDEEGFFDGFGPTRKFYEKALWADRETMEFLQEIDPEWQSHLSAKELSYIKFHSQHQIDLHHLDYGDEYSDKIEHYFDASGPTKALAVDLLMDSNTFYVRRVAEIPELSTLLEPTWQSYLKTLKSTGFKQAFLFELRLDADEIARCFDADGARPELWQLGFAQGQFEFLLSQPETVRENMRLSPKQQSTLAAFHKIKDGRNQTIFKDFILEDFDNLSDERLELAPSILDKLADSNASEMSQHTSALARLLLLADDPEKALRKIEEVFVRNNLPFVGKAFAVFDILHPGDRLEADFDIKNSTTVSPTLKEANNHERRQIIFTDLLKCAFGSNNRSLRTFLSSLSENQALLDALASGQKQWADLSADETASLQNFTSKLATVFDKTAAGKGGERQAKASLESELSDLIQSFQPNARYTLSDRIVRMFAYPMGLKNLAAATEYLDNKKSQADQRNRQAARHKFSLDVGDLVKGVSGGSYLPYLPNILQNGSVAREFLGDSAHSDQTPLDTDLSMILENSANIDSAIRGTAANGFGKIWLVLKAGPRFKVTRGGLGDSQPVEISRHSHRDDGQLELFKTGVAGQDHYGIRTGFASSEIDAIITNGFDERIGVEIAKNGFYIPVVDRQTGQVVFTPENYDKLVKEMSGLSYYGQADYEFAPDLSSPKVAELADLVELNQRQTSQKRAVITQTIGIALGGVGLKLKDFDGTLTPGAELIDTGSTGRGTNAYGDGDFDFMLRVDRSDFLNPDRLAEIKNALATALGGPPISTGDFRLKNVTIDGLDQPVDIDISFIEKTNKLNYSTEQALKDRLESIRQASPSRYQEVVANILLAKQVLKSAAAYKPKRGETPQGGLGGVGVENWVLQHGGSFEAAARDFLSVAEGKTFEEFAESYPVWDFGENHLAVRNGHYAHDNFVTANMDAAGFERMKSALREFIA
jgi:hypothetical protein